MNQKIVRFFAAVLLGVMIVGIVQMGTLIEYRQVQPAFAAELDETDIISFAEVELDDVDYQIEEASTTKALRQGYLSKIRVIGGTTNYYIKEFPEFYDAVHLANDPTFLREFWQLRKLGFTARDLMTGANNLQFQKTLAQVDAQTGYQFQVQTKFTKFTAGNDSADGTGDTMKEEETYSIDDLGALTTKGEISLNASSYSSWGTVESDYQKYEDLFSGNTSATDLYAKPAEEVKRITLVSGFLDFQEAMKEVLRSNIAANESTASDTITPDRVTILDYTLNNSQLYEYISATFANVVRQAVEEYEADKTSATAVVHLFGLELYRCTAAVPLSFFRPTPVLAANPFANLFGQVAQVAKAVVSKSLSTVQTATGTAVRSLDQLKNTFVKTVSGTVTKAQNTAKALVRTGLKTAQNTVKTVQGVAKTFVGHTQRAITGIVSTVGNVASLPGKMVSKGFSSIVGGLGGAVGGFIRFIGMAALAIGGIILIIIIAIGLLKFRGRAMPRG